MTISAGNLKKEQCTKAKGHDDGSSPGSSCCRSKQGRLNLSLKESRRRKKLSKLKEKCNDEKLTDKHEEEGSCSSKTTRHVTVDVTRIPRSIVEKYTISPPSSLELHSQPASGRTSLPSTPPAAMSAKRCTTTSTAPTVTTASPLLPSASRFRRRKRKANEPIVTSTITVSKRRCTRLSYEDAIKLAIEQSLLSGKSKENESTRVAESAPEKEDDICQLAEKEENFIRGNIESSSQMVCSVELCSDERVHGLVDEGMSDDTDSRDNLSGRAIEPQPMKVFEEEEKMVNELRSTLDKQAEYEKEDDGSNLPCSNVSNPQEQVDEKVVVSGHDSNSEMELCSRVFVGNESPEEEPLFVEKHKVENIDKDFSLSSFCFASGSEAGSMELESSGSKADDEVEGTRTVNERGYNKYIEGNDAKYIRTREMTYEQSPLVSACCEGGGIITPVAEPPTVGYLMDTSVFYNLPSARHTELFCSNPDDVQPAK